MELSLVLCTVGRDEELRRYVDSLAAQSFADWRLVVVDQNEDRSIVQRALAPLSGRPRVQVLRQAPGLSRARNAGWRAAAGGWVMFPDDDCLYPAPTTLATVVRLLADLPGTAAVCCFPVAYGRAEDAADLDDAPMLRPVPSVSSARGVSLASAGMAVRMDLLRTAGGFDEDFGIGGRFGGGEDLELAARVIAEGRQVWSSSFPHIAHPPLPGNEKRIPYAESRGAIMRKHAAWGWLLRDLLRTAKNGALRGDAAQALAEPAAVLRGWRAYGEVLRVASATSSAPSA